MTNDEGNPKPECRNGPSCAFADFVLRISAFVIGICEAWFMESPLSPWRMEWDHEPRFWSADLQVGAIGARTTTPSWNSALLFLDRRLDLLSTER